MHGIHNRCSSPQQDGCVFLKTAWTVRKRFSSILDNSFQISWPSTCLITFYLLSSCSLWKYRPFIGWNGYTWLVSRDPLRSNQPLALLADPSWLKSSITSLFYDIHFQLVQWASQSNIFPTGPVSIVLKYPPTLFFKNTDILSWS